MTLSIQSSLHGDRWDGSSNQEWTIDAVSEDDFERSLLQLDAREYTLLSIEKAAQQHLTLGGGSGRYVVYATLGGQTFNLLSASTEPPSVVMLTAGGQEGDFPSRQVVSLDQALAAGRVFLRTGQLDDTQTWEQE